MAVVMTVLWLVQRARGDAGIVDVAWSFGTGLRGRRLRPHGGRLGPRQMLVAVLAALWGARLGTYLVLRSRGAGEDGRYRDMRAAWGEQAQRNLFLFFQLQASWAVLFALPMGSAAANADARASGGSTRSASLIWIVALVGESPGRRAAAAVPGQIPRIAEGSADVGLWSFSRHPNYFFEWVHWWAYVALGLSGPWGWVTLFGPAVMLVLPAPRDRHPPCREARAQPARATPTGATGPARTPSSPGRERKVVSHDARCHHPPRHRTRRARSRAAFGRTRRASAGWFGSDC